MAQVITQQMINSFRERLEDHPVYALVDSVEALRCFMQHHVYSVWDFMSLIKFLQRVVAPAEYPWVPRGDADVRRFINELVLEEESDQGSTEGQYTSHFELYQRAMQEIGADVAISRQFISSVMDQGVEAALEQVPIPEPSRRFTRQTFAFLNSGRPHEVAAALALGREHIIPVIFRSILQRIGVDEDQAPIFHLYLNRHIHLDEDFHAPLSLRLLEQLCGSDEQKVTQAVEAANRAIDARIEFWDGVAQTLSSR